MAQKKSHKDGFIAEHGQEKWDLVRSYWNGNRSPEATEANKLYLRFAHGLNQDTWTVYGILENGILKYVGSTGIDWRTRWSNHKSHARRLAKGASALHYAMNATSTNHKLFAEYTFTILHTYSDQQTAKDMEEALIKAHQTHIHGYNVYIGGGNKSKKFKTRPISQPDDIETR